MNIGDYVQMNVGKPLKGFVVEPPPRAARLAWNKTSIWILITKTPDGNFVGKILDIKRTRATCSVEGRTGTFNVPLRIMEAI